MKNVKSPILWAIIVFCIIAVCIVAPYCVTFGDNLSANSTDWGAFGSYFSGMFMPVVTLMNIIVLIILSRSVSNYIAEIKQEHNRKINKQNEDVDHEYKIKLDPNINIEELYITLRHNSDRAKELLHHFDKSSEMCKKDLEEIFERLNIDKSLIDSIPYKENPFLNRDWEMRALGINNWVSENNLYMLQLKVKIYELLSAQDNSYTDKYKMAIKEFETNHKGASYVD